MTAGSDAPVLLEVEGGVATVTLNRPASSNAISHEVADGLLEAVRQVAADPAARVVLLRGNGRLFCAGGDVKAMAAVPAGPEREVFLTGLATAAHEPVTALADLELPVVAAVQGAAAGAGLALVLAADLVVAGRGARFLSGYAGIGVTPDCGTSALLPAVVGLRRALELTLTGRVLQATEALNWGIVTQVCPDDELVSVAAGWAAQVAAGPVPALGATRRLLRSGLDTPFGDQLLAEAAGIGRCAGTPEAEELLAAFVAKRR